MRRGRFPTFMIDMGVFETWKQPISVNHGSLSKNFVHFWIVSSQVIIPTYNIHLDPNDPYILEDLTHKIEDQLGPNSRDWHTKNMCNMCVVMCIYKCYLCMHILHICRYIYYSIYIYLVVACTCVHICIYIYNHPVSLCPPIPSTSKFC